MHSLVTGIVYTLPEIIRKLCLVAIAQSRTLSDFIEYCMLKFSQCVIYLQMYIVDLHMCYSLINCHICVCIFEVMKF